jgi:hypothetical protein
LYEKISSGYNTATEFYESWLQKAEENAEREKTWPKMTVYKNDALKKIKRREL